MLSTTKNMLDTIRSVKHNGAGMLSIEGVQKAPRPLSSGELAFFLEAWQSGLLHRAYPSADLWASIPLAGSREFEPHRFRQLTSGVAVAPSDSDPRSSTQGFGPRANDRSG